MHFLCDYVIETTTQSPIKAGFMWTNPEFRYTFQEHGVLRTQGILITLKPIPYILTRTSM